MFSGKKALIGALLILIAVAGVASYFTFFSPRESSVSATVAHASLASTASQSLEGVVSPEESGRLVILQIEGQTGWVEVARTTTDAAGVFKLSFPMTDLGEHGVRVRVEADGRAQAATSAVENVLVLQPTQVQVRVPRFARADKPLRVAGRVAPAVGPRTVNIETSPDGQTWSPGGQSTADAATGQFTVAARKLSPGQLYIRVTIDESAEAATATSKPRVVSVEDYVAAGHRYLQIVAPTNKLIEQLNALSAYASYTVYKPICAKLSVALSKEAKQFRRYAYWPREVEKYIAVLAKANVLRADFYNQLGNADSSAEFAAISSPDLPKGADNAAALTREALGLPKRG